jgi:hypothetical protein
MFSDEKLNFLVPNLFVLTVTTGDERLKEILRRCEEQT